MNGICEIYVYANGLEEGLTLCDTMSNNTSCDHDI